MNVYDKCCVCTKSMKRGAIACVNCGHLLHGPCQVGLDPQLCPNCQDIEDAEPIVRKTRAAYRDSDRKRIVKATLVKNGNL